MILKKAVKKFFKFFNLEISRKNVFITKALKENNVEILHDKNFRKSVIEVSRHTLLDIYRLANLWTLSQMTNPKGVMIEIGAFRGGSSLHLSNANPNRKIYICDSFEGFEKLDKNLDNQFSMKDFKKTNEQKVRNLFIDKKNSFEIIKGIFPYSFKDVVSEPISFAHLDVDIYKSTKESLEFLNEIMIEKSLIVIDDYKRQAKGVEKAVGEFTDKNKNWIVFPIFPSQGLLIHKSFFD